MRAKLAAVTERILPRLSLTKARLITIAILLDSRRPTFGSRRGGKSKDNMMGCSVTTLTEIVKIQKLERIASWRIAAMPATARLRIASPSDAIATNAGENKLKYDWRIARSLSPRRKYSS